MNSIMKILLIEDEPKINQNIKQGLTQEKHIVDSAFDGEKGYDLASTETYDLIILDLMLPKLNGLEICRQLRLDQNHTPILMLTAKNQVQDKVTGLNSGADDYLAKPFAFSELLARIHALGRRPKKTLNNILEFSDITLNSLTYEVKRKNKVIELSRKEFTLLEYFMKNPQRIITKDQLIQSVWDYEADILPNTVEVYVGYLRTKLGRPNVIQTNRGFGYKLSLK